MSEEMENFEETSDVEGVESPVVNDPDKELEIYRNYNDPDFQKEKTVFGERSKLDYEYSDRLDLERARLASKTADQSGANPKTQRWYENYLSAYFGKPVELKHIIVGGNSKNGRYYQIFGFRFKEIPK